jgi:hypothetical protein
MIIIIIIVNRVSTDVSAFFDLAQSKNKIVTHLNAHGALQMIQNAAEMPSFAVSETGVPGLLHFVYKVGRSLFRVGCARQPNPIVVSLVPRVNSQARRSELHISIDTRENGIFVRFDYAKAKSPILLTHRSLFRLYQHVFAAMRERNPPHKVYYHTTDKETIVGWVTQTFELYAVSGSCRISSFQQLNETLFFTQVFGPLEAKSATIKACNSLLRWIKKHEESLFILSSPVW